MLKTPYGQGGGLSSLTPSMGSRIEAFAGEFGQPNIHERSVALLKVGDLGNTESEPFVADEQTRLYYLIYQNPETPHAAFNSQHQMKCRIAVKQYLSGLLKLRKGQRPSRNAR